MLRLIYLLSKAIHSVTTIIACICFYLAASTSDYYVMSLGQTEPDSFYWFLLAGAVMLIPCVIYSIFNLLLEIARSRVKAQKGTRK